MSGYNPEPKKTLYIVRCKLLPGNPELEPIEMVYYTFTPFDLRPMMQWLESIGTEYFTPTYTVKHLVSKS